MVVLLARVSGDTWPWCPKINSISDVRNTWRLKEAGYKLQLGFNPSWSLSESKFHNISSVKGGAQVDGGRSGQGQYLARQDASLGIK